MVSQKLLGIVDMRCRQATGLMTVSFGGLNVTLTGDPGQLLPVCKKCLNLKLQLLKYFHTISWYSSLSKRNELFRWTCSVSIVSSSC